MKIKADTIIRTILLAIALINQVLTSLGKNPLPFSEDTIYQFLTACVTIATAIWSWWKNNSFTDAAITADTLKDALKSGKFDDEEAQEQLEDIDEEARG